jgi:hypothetical protein
VRARTANLTATLTPDEASRLLDLPPELIDCLLASGRVLCRLQGGEPRIPLEQLESFFRDALVNVYRAETLATMPVPAPQAIAGEPVSQAAAHQPAPQTVPEPAEDASPEPLPQPEPLLVPAPVALADPEPAPDEKAELRRAARYIPRRQIDGFFNETKFSIVQISESGLRIRHRSSLLPGDEAKVSIALLDTAQSVVLRARVVWTSIARSEGETFSISGLRVIEHSDRLASAVAMLRAKHELQPERRAQQRRSGDAMIVLDGIADDEITRVVSTVQRFAADPIEAGRWHSRARFAVSDPEVRRAAPHHPREREEVLAIWESLDRQVEIPKITSIVSWMRKTKAVV